MPTDRRTRTGTRSTRSTQSRMSQTAQYHRKLRDNVEAVLRGTPEIREANFPALARRYLRAAARGNPETLKIFLSAGMDVNFSADDTGLTALHIAAAGGARPLIRMLLREQRINLLTRDHEGRLPSELAFVLGRDPVLARFLRLKERYAANERGLVLTRRQTRKKPTIN